MSGGATRIDRCVVCGGHVALCLDLGTQPVANLLLATDGEAYVAHPLGLAACEDCSHGQLTHFLDPKELFSTYLYASGTSNTLRSYFQWFAKTLHTVVPHGARVLEVACNDGSLLRCLASEGFEVAGVDPATNLAAEARAGGLHVLSGFFPETSPEGRFDAIIAMNVVAHTPDPRGFMEGVRRALAPGGIAFIQTSQAMMLDRGEFDTVYHEHYSFFTPASMQRLARECGLRLDGLGLVSVHGGSMLAMLRHSDAPRTPLTFDGGPPFALAWPQPEPSSMTLELGAAGTRAAYRTFAAMAAGSMTSAAERIDAHRSHGRTVALVGIAAKALTFMRASGIEPDVLIDEARLKVGRVAPGMAGKIEPIERVRELPDDTLFVIGAWNFADELSRKVRAHRDGMRSRFLTYFPAISESE